MSTVTVRLGEPLWRQVNAKQIVLTLPAGASVADMLSRLAEEHPALAEYLQSDELPPTVFLAGTVAAADTPLADGDEPMLMWAAAGGAPRNMRRSHA